MATRAAKSKVKPKVKKAVAKVKGAAKKPARKAPLKAQPKAASPKRKVTAKGPAKKGPVKAAAKKPPAVRTVSPKVTSRLSGATVNDYIASVPAPFRAVLAELKQVVLTAAPEAHCCIKWGQPVFELYGPFAWMKAFSTHADLGFWRGAELPDPDGILQGRGGKMRHVKITEPEHVPVSKLDALVRAAVALNKEKGDPSRRPAR